MYMKRLQASTRFSQFPERPWPLNADYDITSTGKKGLAKVESRVSWSRLVSFGRATKPGGLADSPPLEEVYLQQLGFAFFYQVTAATRHHGVLHRVLGILHIFI